MNPPSFLTDSDELLSYLQDFASVSVPDAQIVATVRNMTDLKQNGDKALLERTMLYDEVRFPRKTFPLPPQIWRKPSQA